MPPSLVIGRCAMHALRNPFNRLSRKGFPPVAVIHPWMLVFGSDSNTFVMLSLDGGWDGGVVSNVTSTALSGMKALPTQLLLSAPLPRNALCSSFPLRSARSNRPSTIVTRSSRRPFFAKRDQHFHRFLSSGFSVLVDGRNSCIACCWARRVCTIDDVGIIPRHYRKNVSRLCLRLIPINT